MPRSHWICTIVVFLASMSLTAKADVYKAGDGFTGFSAPDQHGTDFTFKAGDARVILFDTPVANGEARPSPDPDWFVKNHVLPVVNFSDLAFFQRKAAQSRLSAKTYRVLVVDNKSVAERFPVQSGKFTVLFLSAQGVITDIRFAAPGNELRELLTNKTATGG